MKAAVINLSHPHYNLGCAKLSTWFRERGDAVQEYSGDPGLFLNGFDLVCMSAIFSWDVPKGVQIARRSECEVWSGGPGFLHMRDWWKMQTGLDAHYGLDQRFERQRGKYRMTFAARGCPWNCHFCGVSKWEGKEYSLDWDFQPAPLLGDNDITDEPVEFQDHIIRRYRETGTQLMDANSGFEPFNFNQETYERWKPILRGPWRFGYDYLPERGPVKRMLEILKDEHRNKKAVYVMIGNEPFEACLQRATEVIEWGGLPFVQPFLPKTALSRTDFILRHDWTRDMLVHFARYFNRYVWKQRPINEYMLGTKHPFGDGPPRPVVAPSLSGFDTLVQIT